VITAQRVVDALRSSDSPSKARLTRTLEEEQRKPQTGDALAKPTMPDSIEQPKAAPAGSGPARMRPDSLSISVDAWQRTRLIEEAAFPRSVKPNLGTSVRLLGWFLLSVSRFLVLGPPWIRHDVRRLSARLISRHSQVLVHARKINSAVRSQQGQMGQTKRRPAD
jgi:hypothetical protein